jgi:hypothetical protein
VKSLRKEFELADIDSISMQSSCSNYDKILDDKNYLEVCYSTLCSKAAAYNNLLYNNKQYQEKYEFVNLVLKLSIMFVKIKV